MRRARITVYPATAPLYGSVPVPKDSRIVSRALLLAGLANGPSRIVGFSDTGEQRALVNGLAALGVPIQSDGALLVVNGVGFYGLRPPDRPINCGSARSAFFALAGLLSAQRFPSSLDGTLPAEELEPLLTLLVARGASIDARAGGPPWRIQPAKERLLPLEISLSGTDADLKSALLISGLYAAGPTTLYEHVVAEDHLERLLDAMQLPVHSIGPALSLHAPAESEKVVGFEIDVPGDISLAAFLMAGGCLVPGSAVTVRQTSLNPSRAAIVDVLRLFGGKLGITPHGDVFGEPVGEVTVQASELRACAINGEPAWRVFRDLAVVCTLAARASGTTEIGDLVGEAQAEHYSVATMVELLQAFGVAARMEAGTLLIEGRPGAGLCAAEVDAGGHADVVLAATVLGLLADAPSRIEGAECIAERFPRFVGTLRALGARLKVEQ